MPLDTVPQILAEYRATADYDVTGSSDKAKRFIVACRLLLGTRPSGAAHGSARAEFDPDVVERQLREAQDWYRANGDTVVNGGVTHFSLENFRQ